jgi:hypothetical protein
MTKLNIKLTPFHPILFAWFPIVSIYSTNQRDISVLELPFPLAVATCASILIFLVCALIAGGRAKGAIVASVTIILLFMYGPIAAAFVRDLNARDEMRTTIENSVLAAYAVIFVVLCAGMRRVKRDLTVPNTWFDRASAIILVVVALSAGMSKMESSSPKIGDGKVEEKLADPDVERLLANAATGAGPSEKPDIYFFIADAYTRADFLKETFQFDNTEFLNQLRGRGFEISEDSYSNYDGTVYSLASTLNMNYHTDKDGSEFTQTWFAQLAWKSLQQCSAGRYLQKIGYRFVAYATPFTPLKIKIADETISGVFVLSEFQDILLSRTPLNVTSQRTGGAFQSGRARDRIEYVFRSIPEQKRADGPTFVFGYVCAPHPPFIFRADGSPAEEKRALSFSDAGEFRALGGTPEEYRIGYVEQLQFINRKLLEMVDRIIAHSPNAIIIIQGDHGVRDYRPDGETAQGRLHGTKILAAIRSPQKSLGDKMRTGFSSVNTFRLIFNAYFDAELPVLPRRIYSLKVRGTPAFYDITGDLPASRTEVQGTPIKQPS